MARVIYSEKFKLEAVKQVTNNGYSINDTAQYNVPRENNQLIKSFYSKC